MKKYVLTLLLFLSVNGIFASDYLIKLHISNIQVSSHKLYVLIYNSENTYNKTPFEIHIISSDKEEITNIYSLPEGEYVITVFQDLNDNTKLDTNIIGIPKEPVGISNYSGKGIPGGFNTLKLQISNNNITIPIKLKEIKN